MAPPTTEKNEQSNSAPESPTTNGKESDLPTWINEENFQSVFEENVEGFQKSLHFEVKETGGGGENYASMMMRVKAQLELTDGSTKDIAFMIKTTPKSEQGAVMIEMMGLFPKESQMYGKYLREFEETYSSVGKEITFGPKFYKLKNDPGVPYVLLEDISPRGFKNVNRQKGLDKEHTESVLKMLAELHAVSAQRYAEQGVYDELLMKSPFPEESRVDLDNMMKNFIKTINDSYAKHEAGLKFMPKLKPIFERLTDIYIEDSKVDLNNFNVIIHGDLWSNNIMFRHNDEGKLEETIFVDFQMCRFSTPVVDLFYFLLSSPSLDIKVSCFDEFVKFYHDHLTENLKLLNYSKKLPTLKQLRMDMLRYSSWSVSTLTGIMAAVLLDPVENANLDHFFGEDKEATNFKNQMYENPRYIQHLEVVLPWLDKMGFLDES